MDRADLSRAGRNSLTQEIATRSTDPDFYGALNFLPNPDQVLQRLGRTQEVYDAIEHDAHVMGELRAVRGGLLGFEWRLQPGGDSPADIKALELCQAFMDRRPASGMRWSDVFWNMGKAVFKGYAVHEVVWERDGNYLLPAKVLDRPQRRFLFSPDNELRLLTKQSASEGEIVGPRKWLLTRHMHSQENPYGLAVYSACFWPYTFKHTSFRYFMKFCEKYGIPWAIGRYPEGTPKEMQDELADQLARMVEDAVAAIPDTGKVELLEHKHSGELVHERLINVCNREMSKAITSQTLATEIQGQGSRAASDTHHEREQAGFQSDRACIEDTFDDLFSWVTEINVPNAKAPRMEFFEEAEARKEWTEVLEKAREFMDIPKSFGHERLQIPMPEEGEEVLPRSGRVAAPPSEFNACPSCGKVHDYAEDDDPVASLARQASARADRLVEDMVDDVRELLDQVGTLQEFRDGLSRIYGDLDERALGELTSQALMTGMLEGMDARP